MIAWSLRTVELCTFLLLAGDWEQQCPGRLRVCVVNVGSCDLVVEHLLRFSLYLWVSHTMGTRIVRQSDFSTE